MNGVDGFFSGAELVIMNENCGDFPTVCGIDLMSFLRGGADDGQQAQQRHPNHSKGQVHGR